MASVARMAEIAALVGDPSRAAMLQALMDGRALTAAELAGAAGVAPQTASGHLAQLSEAGLIALARQGRHRYHRLATPLVARMIESVMLVAAEAAPRPVRTGPKDARLRFARTCYDHIAGQLGVALADGLTAQGWIRLDEEAGLVTAEGERHFAAIGITAASASGKAGAPLCRPCLDWSERRMHLAGRLGAAICRHGLERGWIRKQAASRALTLTPVGRRAYREVFGAEIAAEA